MDQTRSAEKMYSEKMYAEKMYANNLGLVGHGLKHFPFLGSPPFSPEDREEAFGAGLLGLWKAAEGFDPDRGFTFSTYAADTIRGYILKYLRTWKQAHRLPCVSLDTPLGNAHSGGSGENILADVIGDTCGAFSSTPLERPGAALLAAAGFDALVSGLPERQQDVLRQIYADELTPAEIGAAWGVSRTAVRSVQQTALRQMRRRLPCV